MGQVLHLHHVFLTRSLGPVFVLVGLLCLILAGCASDGTKPLPDRSALVSSVAALDRTRRDAPPIDPGQPLSLASVALLAVQNSPDLRAVRTQQGVAQAQIVQAGLLPDPVLSGSYNFLLGGPGIANAVGATLTGDVSSLVTLSARRRAAQEAAFQVDANVVWQEWQTISRAQTLAIDLVEQERLLHSLEQARDLLQQRATTSTRAVTQGNATLQVLAPDLAALTSLQTQYDVAALAQEQRWQSLDALLGLEPNIRPLLSATLRVPRPDPGETAAMLASLPQRRPDLIALQLGYEAQQANLRAAVLGQFPTVTLGPNYGSDNTNVQSIGPSASLTLPLFNRNRGAVALQRATRAQLREEYVARLAAASGGAQALLANLALLERQIAEARAGLGQSRLLAANADGVLRSGLLDELSYVQLVTTRLEKEQQVIGLEQQILDERTALATLLGVGLPPVRLVRSKPPSLL